MMMLTRMWFVRTDCTNRKTSSLGRIIVCRAASLFASVWQVLLPYGALQGRCRCAGYVHCPRHELAPPSARVDSWQSRGVFFVRRQQLRGEYYEDGRHGWQYLDKDFLVSAEIQSSWNKGWSLASQFKTENSNRKDMDGNADDVTWQSHRNRTPLACPHGVLGRVMAHYTVLRKADATRYARHRCENVRTMHACH